MIVKLGYDWYEGEYMEYHIVIDDEEKFEKDLKDVIKICNETTNIKMLPMLFDCAIDKLEKKGYIIDFTNDNISYQFFDGLDMLYVEKQIKKIDRETIQ